MYPQMIEQRTLGRFQINYQEVRKHYIEKGEIKEDQFGQIQFEPQFYTLMPNGNFTAHTIEKIPKYISCSDCGKFLSYSEADADSIRRMGEKARVLYVEDAEKQRQEDVKFNDDAMQGEIIVIKNEQLRHIRDDIEISNDSYNFMYKYIASILDGIEENNRNKREGKEVNGHTISCDSCKRGTWWCDIP